MCRRFRVLIGCQRHLVTGRAWCHGWDIRCAVSSSAGKEQFRSNADTFTTITRCLTDRARPAWVVAEKGFTSSRGYMWNKTILKQFRNKTPILYQSDFSRWNCFWKLFRRHRTCWKIFASRNTLRKFFRNNFRQNCLRRSSTKAEIVLK